MFSALLTYTQEAVRLTTPPLYEDPTDGRLRGFFSSLVPPNEDRSEAPSSGPNSSTSAKGSPQTGNDQKRSLTPKPREWWDEVPLRSAHRDPRQAHDKPNPAFEFDIPEHLPNSPMCPANARHPSQGTGMCVYHGRRRFGSDTGEGQARRRLFETENDD